MQEGNQTTLKVEFEYVIVHKNTNDLNQKSDAAAHYKITLSNTLLNYFSVNYISYKLH